jgi:hypothetical protein
MSTRFLIPELVISLDHHRTIQDDSLPTACFTPSVPATLWAYKKPLPTPTALAPKQRALTTSVPRLIPPSTYISNGLEAFSEESSTGVKRSGLDTDAVDGPVGALN